jgi:hypothetical protein
MGKGQKTSPKSYDDDDADLGDSNEHLTSEAITHGDL